MAASKLKCRTIVEVGQSMAGSRMAGFTQIKMPSVLSVNDLPPEKLPDFWEDNARINALYAPFRDRSVNARDWDSKLVFWKSLINTWTNFNKLCAFSESELKKWFIKNGRVPACLNIVLSEMHKNQELQTLSQFMEFPQKSWSGWAVNLAIKKPLIWSFNKVKNTFIAPINSDTKFVHLPTVKNLSDKLFTSVPEVHRNKLLTVDEIIDVTNFKNVDTETVKLLLHYLQCQDKIETLQNPDIHSESSEETPLLIKIALNNSNKVQPINEIDMAKHRLEANEKLLLKKIEDLESAKTEATKNAKQYVAKGMRQMAKTCLRKQHEMEKRIEKQVNVLENVQILLSRIGTAETDSKVIDSYKSGLVALKTVFKENGLTEDAVADTMLEMTDTLETHDDIQSTLSQSITSDLDAELEEELAELMNESSQPPTQPTSPGGRGVEDNKSVQDDLERRLHNLKLPSVPAGSPSSSPVKHTASFS